MDHPIVELFITYDDTIKLIIYESGTPLDQFYRQLQTEFGIQSNVKLFADGAQITSTRSLSHNRQLTIRAFENIPPPPELREDSPIVLQPQHSDSNPITDPTSIPFNDIQSVEFVGSELINKIINWANNKGFHLQCSGGAKQLQNYYSRSLICATSNCSYKLTFKSTIIDGMYVLDEKLAKKNNKHSIHFFYYQCIIINI